MKITEYNTFLLDQNLAAYRTIGGVVAVLAFITLGINDLVFAALMIIPIVIVYLLGFMLVGFITGFMRPERIRYDTAIASLQKEIKAGRISEADAAQMLANMDSETITQGTKIIEFGPQFGAVQDHRMFEYLIAKMDQTGDEIKFVYFAVVDTLPDESENQDVRWYMDFEGIRYVREDEKSET